MAGDVKVGTCFSSFVEFEQFRENYENKSCIQLYTRNSQTIDNYRKIAKKHCNEL